MGPLTGRVVVLTGATGPVGQETARRLVGAGAHVVLAAADEAVEELARAIGAVGVRADLARPDEAERVAAAADDAFGQLDVWINHATEGCVGALTELPLEAQQRVMDARFWAAVYGSVAAVPRLRARGGTLINVCGGSSRRAFPPYGPTSLAAHALVAFTSALRLELEHEGVPVAVTLIEPASLPSAETRPGRGSLPLFLYDPAVLARAIVACARRPRRRLVVGGLGVLSLRWSEKLAPRLADRIMVANLRWQGPRQRPRPVRRRSLYTALALHPGRAALVVAAGALIWMAIRAGRAARPEPRMGRPPG